MKPCALRSGKLGLPLYLNKMPYRPGVEKLVLRDYAIRIVRLRYLPDLGLLWRVKVFPDSGGVPMPGLTIKDLEKLQVQHPDYRMELVGGEIVVMSPSGYESDEVAAEIIAQLRNWVRPRRLGRVTASNAGFILPNADKDVRAPDASFVRAERLPRTTGDYAQLVPDLMFEVKSKTDSLPKLRQKIQEFLALGTQVGVLVDPRSRTMEVYRSGVEKEVLRDGDVLTVPELLPGWELAVAEIWAPEFD